MCYTNKNKSLSVLFTKTVAILVTCWAIIGAGAEKCGRQFDEGDMPDFVRNHTDGRLGPVKRDSRVLDIAVIAPHDEKHTFHLRMLMPVIELAVKKIIHDPGMNGPLPGWTVRVHEKDSKCSSVFSGLASFYYFLDAEADVFLGPVCDDYVLAPVARYAAVWGIPILTPAGKAKAFQCKEEYGLLTRMMGSYREIGQLFEVVMNSFGWSTFAMLFENIGASDALGSCKLMMNSVYEWFNSSVPFEYFIRNDADYKGKLLNVTRDARIIVLCASPDRVRNILLAAEELNMIDSGEYVFFNVELLNGANSEPWRSTNDSEENNARAKKAFEAVLTVTAWTPDTEEYKDFSTEVKARAKTKYNYTYEEDTVNTFVTAFYESVLLYSLALNETLARGGRVTDGRTITSLMWNRTFEGITGNVTIDANGDRKADYSLLDLNPETGKFEVVANYYGRTGKLVDVPGKAIHWAGGRTSPPPDTPPCGFDGSLCPDNTFPAYAIVSIVLSSVVLILCVISFFIWRHYKIEAELAQMTWKVAWSDVRMNSMTGGKQLKRSSSRMSLSRISVDSSCSVGSIVAHGGNKQLYTKTAVYKGSIVAVKKLGPHMDVTRPILIELKRMKDLHHDHLVRFIGACISPCCILTEYCPKGSLQDILENDHIKLDWMFRYSLMHDIVKGMSYLHGSELRAHRNLKSSNCVVDSRFVLKLTDFGLGELKRSLDRHQPDEEDSYAYWRSKLWTAPEILEREPVNDQLFQASYELYQRADVYSFAIIVHEIVMREGPFYLNTCDSQPQPQEIVEAVKSHEKPFLRPTISDDACEEEVIRIMKSCWADEPLERPDFQQLKGIIRKLNKENESGNILDNLLSRMEQYANNLEALVEERTADYLEEKRRCEELLYQLLPKSVAIHLIAGKSVVAESFDSVTIYFSDIVGFTSLSAESTAMQVVDLLNDLYTCFDSIIENFDVYKVETIGDAYMVVSGLPVRNGMNHAREIARMALNLREAVFKFRIRHRPDDQLKLRIGVHTGPVCAGVVGRKMPRYCLFGDTVNTSSRMESNGQPLKIHVSAQTKEVLDTFGSFILECRGEIEMKGKGKQVTYWLLGEHEPPKHSASDVFPASVASQPNGIAGQLAGNATGSEPTSATKTATPSGHKPVFDFSSPAAETPLAPGAASTPPIRPTSILTNALGGSNSQLHAVLSPSSSKIHFAPGTNAVSYEPGTGTSASSKLLVANNHSSGALSAPANATPGSNNGAGAKSILKTNSIPA